MAELVKTGKNWKLCALCEQDNTGEKLVCPFNNKRKDSGSGYSSLAEILPKFEEIGELPIQVPLSSLDDGRGIEETLRSHRASWHKTCFNRCSNEKLIRAQKRKREESSDNSDNETSIPHSPVKTRASKGIPVNSGDGIRQCFFCEETGTFFILLFYFDISVNQICILVQKGQI